ncbi:E3 ubiquitin-protein ligase znrf2 isoform X2 [Phthorimaea operculella]|nr:E3 ubiquitin-protein ligase znrf2 isoform X2 [Phthorimaea operculella]
MGAKASTANGGQSPRARTFSTSSSSEVVSGTGFSLLRAIPGIQVASDRQRARSLSSVPDLHASHEAIAIPANSQSYEASAAASPDTDSSSNEEPGPVPGTSLALGRVYAAHSLPSHIWSLNDVLRLNWILIRTKTSFKNFLFGDIISEYNERVQNNI